MSLRTQRMQKAETIGAFMFELHERDDAVEEFDNRLWFMTVDKVVVKRNGKLVYYFRNGTEVEV